MANVVQVTMDLDLDSFKAQLSKAEDASQDAGKKIGKNVGDGAEKGAGDYLKGLEKRLLALGALVAGAISFKKIVEEAAGADQAVARMNQSLVNAGSYSKAASNDMVEFAERMQKLTGVDDTATQGLLSLAKSFGVTNEKAKQMTETAINLAAATGMSLDGAMRALGGTLDGSTGRLGKLAVGLKDMTPEALKAGGAIDYFQKRFTGSAAGQLDSFSGALKTVENSFGDVVKELGFLITRSPIVTKGLQLIGQMFSQLGDYLQDFRKRGVDVVGIFIMRVVDAGQAVAKVLLPALEILTNIGVVVFKAMAAGVSTVVTGVLGLTYVFGQLQEKVGLMSADSVEALKNMFEASKETTAQLATETADAMSNTFSTAGSDAALGFVDNFRNQLYTGMGALKETAALGVKDINDQIATTGAQTDWSLFLQGFDNATKRAAGSLEELGKKTNQILVTGMGNAFVKMGEAWQNGTDVFEAFGKVILGVFADLAIQLGTFYFTLGLANLFLNPVAASAEIVGGLALMTLGGVLKALSGGGGSGAPATSVTPSGGIAVNNGANIGGDVTNVSDQNNEPKTAVNVNIQGNVLDRRQTGLEIAEALNEAGFANGVTF